MNGFSRRTFLASSAGVAGAAAAGASLPAGSTDEAGGAERVTRALDEAAQQPGAPRATGLSVNGLTSPVGIDPDGCFFAWKLRATGRGAAQSAFRIALRRTDAGHSGIAWDTPPVDSASQAFVPYGGPPLAADAAYRWTVRARGADAHWGPVSAPAYFATGLRDGDWTAAQWLRPAGDSSQPDRVTYLRTEITPPAGTVARATAYVSAAHTYRLYVDGTAVDAWPSFSYPDEQYVRAVDLTGALAGGRRSAIGVLHRWYGPGQGRPASSPGLLLQLSVRYTDGRQAVFGSDTAWREQPAEWLPSPQRNADVGDFVEWVDGRLQPQGWSSPGYDDTAWSPVTVIGPAGTAPFTNTYAQRTTIRETPVHPVRLHSVGGGTVVADFGAIYAARPRVSFPQGEPGRTVTVRAGYLLDPDGEVSTVHGTQETNLASTYIMREGSQAFEAFTYFGFRYLQIENAGQALNGNDIVALARHAAMPDVPAATFSSDDRMLNAVWRLTARSCLYCCNEQFVDTPTREKGPFLWDGANESEGVMGAYGDQNMTWQALRDVARGQSRYWPDGQVNAVYPNGDGARTFGTSTARYPEWLWRYFVSTGDRNTVLARYPSTTRAVAWLWSARQAETGLLYGLADTDNGDPVYGYDLSVAADTVSNVLAVNAMHRVAQLAAVAGATVAAQTWQARAAQLSTAINGMLRRADGSYVDGVDADGVQSSHASQEANALPLAYGVVPAPDRVKVAVYVASLGIDVGPNHGLELLRGLAAANAITGMVHLLTDTSMPGWAHIVASGGTFTWEAWKPSDLIGDSLSHGWGSSALVAIQETLLGISLDEPDASGRVRAVVAPPSAALDRAQGSVPTIAGPVQVAWRRRGMGMTLALTVPANATATVRLPTSTHASVREGGVAVARAPGVRVMSAGDGVVVLSVGSGTYRFTSA